jgi:hypothetical protein
VLQQWYEFEQAETSTALRAWCQENEIELADSGGTQARASKGVIDVYVAGAVPAATARQEPTTPIGGSGSLGPGLAAARVPLAQTRSTVARYKSSAYVMFPCRLPMCVSTMWNTHLYCQ